MPTTSNDHVVPVTTVGYIILPWAFSCWPRCGKGRRHHYVVPPKPLVPNKSRSQQSCSCPFAVEIRAQWARMLRSRSSSAGVSDALIVRLPQEGDSLEQEIREI